MFLAGLELASLGWSRGDAAEIAGLALAEAIRSWEGRGGFGALLRQVVRRRAADLVRQEMAQRRLREGLGRELPRRADQGPRERPSGSGLELRCQLAPRLSRKERLVLDLLVVFQGDRGRVGALLGFSRQRLSAVVGRLREKTLE
jgi:DNA-directed RNA polymerase specialized sigma24 family protein